MTSPRTLQSALRVRQYYFLGEISDEARKGEARARSYEIAQESRLNSFLD